MHLFVTRSGCGALSEFSRSSLGEDWQGIREVKETAILTKSTFSVWEFLRGSLVHLWFVLGLLYEVDRKGTREWNLNKQHIISNRTPRGVRLDYCLLLDSNEPYKA